MFILFYGAIFGFFGLCALLSFFVLIQESKSMGLGASYGKGAMAIGLPKEASFKEIKAKWSSTFDKYPVKARMVKDAPCKENIVYGEEVAKYFMLSKGFSMIGADDDQGFFVQPLFFN